MKRAFLPAVILATSFLTPVLGGPSGDAAGTDGPRYPMALSGEAGVDLATQYFFRGIGQENEDVIAQAYMDLELEVFESRASGSVIDSISLFGGEWVSLHGQRTGAVDDPEFWYETDIYAGVRIGLYEWLEVSPAYLARLSPSGAFDSVHEVNLNFSADDRWIWDDGWTLRPSAQLAFEVEDESDRGSDQGIYGELALEPDLFSVPSEDYPLNVTLPLTLGLSIDNYYENPRTGEDETFGYFDIGVAASMPLAFLSGRGTEWQITGSVHYLLLGESAEALSAANGTGGDEGELSGTLGLQVSF